MISKQLLHVADSHTGGEGTRLLLGQVPDLVGRNMTERRKFFQTNFDYLRTTLTQEPRFFPGVAAILVPPSNRKADYGVIFADFRGYADMCLHGTIGIVTTLFELGLLRNPKNAIVFDTPAGLVGAIANLVDGKIRSVTVRNVLSTYLGSILLNDDDSFGEVTAQIAFGGNTFAYVNASKIGLSVIPENLPNLLKAGNSLLSKLRRAKIIHSKTNTIGKPISILGLSLYEDLATKAGSKRARNIMIADDGMFDRSPCGTGTCGRMALLHAKKKLSIDQEFVNQSIIGSEFIGRIVGRKRIGKSEAIKPEITGSACLTATSDLIVSDDDKFRNGFALHSV